MPKGIDDVSRLAGLSEIAELAGVSRQAVDAWRDRHDDCPQPLTTLRSGPVFDLEEWRRWLVATGRLTDDGKPSKRTGR